MRLISATEASRNFSAVLDSVEHGETVVITRGGRRIATLGPAPVAPGRMVKAMLAKHVGTLDEGFADDIAGARELLTDEVAEWSSD